MRGSSAGRGVLATALVMAAILLALGVLLVAVPHAIPGMIIPGQGPVDQMGSMTP